LVDVTLVQLNKGDTVFDDEAREPLQQSERDAAITLKGQPKFLSSTDITANLGGPLESSSGYVVFRKTDLDNAPSGPIVLQNNDRITQIGHIEFDVYIMRIEPFANYPDTQGPSLFKAWFADREPGKQPGLGDVTIPTAAPFVDNLLVHFAGGIARFQDTGGATPAVAASDPVRRWDDQSGNPFNGISAAGPILHATKTLGGIIPIDGITSPLDPAFSNTLPPIIPPWTMVVLIDPAAVDADIVQLIGDSTKLQNAPVGGPSLDFFLGGVSVVSLATLDTANHLVAISCNAARDTAFMDVDNGTATGSAAYVSGPTTDEITETSLSIADFHEMLFYARDLINDGGLASVVAYLNARFSTGF